VPDTRIKPSVLSLVIAFIGAILALHLSGNSKDFGHIPYYYMQFLPVQALREEPLRSILNLHSQLPLENILFAAVTNVFRFTSSSPQYANDFWKQDTYWIGLIIKQFAFLWLLIYSFARVIARRLPLLLSATVLVLFALMPSTLMYFAYPYSALTSASLLAFLVSELLVDENHSRRLVLSALALALLGLSHNLFSYYFTFPLLIYISCELYKSRHLISSVFVKLALLLLALPLMWMLKNYAMFGITSLTSWSGCALGQSLTPIVRHLPQINIDKQDGWRTALRAIQVSSDYDPLIQVPSPLALNMRMKGEGVRNWNHISVIKSCSEAKKYNLSLLQSNPNIRQQFIYKAKQRLLSVLGNLSSQFVCDGCGFDYSGMGLNSYGSFVNFVSLSPLKPVFVAVYNVSILFVIPVVYSCSLFFSNARTQSSNRTKYLFFALAATNVLIVIAAVTLSTIENERMVWMLMPASTLVALAFASDNTHYPDPL